jgi:hypothetical protein
VTSQADPLHEEVCFVPEKPSRTTHRSKDWFGREKKEYFDSEGRKLGETIYTNTWSGSPKQIHLDANGQRIGSSVRIVDWLGRAVTEHYGETVPRARPAPQPSADGDIAPSNTPTARRSSSDHGPAFFAWLILSGIGMPSSIFIFMHSQPGSPERWFAVFLLLASAPGALVAAVVLAAIALGILWTLLLVALALLVVALVIGGILALVNL